jgi:hypothetical protein
MKIIICDDALNPEQAHFLASCGLELQDGHWLGECEAADYWEAVEELERAGIQDYTVTFV